MNNITAKQAADAIEEYVASIKGKNISIVRVTDFSTDPKEGINGKPDVVLLQRKWIGETTIGTCGCLYTTALNYKGIINLDKYDGGGFYWFLPKIEGVEGFYGLSELTQCFDECTAEGFEEAAALVVSAIRALDKAIS